MRDRNIQQRLVQVVYIQRMSVRHWVRQQPVRPQVQRVITVCFDQTGTLVC